MLTNEDFGNLKAMLSGGKVTAGQVKEALLTAARSGELDVMGLLACQMAGLLDASGCNEVGAAIVATAAAALAGKKRTRPPIDITKNGFLCLYLARPDSKGWGLCMAKDEALHILDNEGLIRQFIKDNDDRLILRKDAPKKAKKEEDDNDEAAEKAA